MTHDGFLLADFIGRQNWPILSILCHALNKVHRSHITNNSYSECSRVCSALTYLLLQNGDGGYHRELQSRPTVHSVPMSVHVRLRRQTRLCSRCQCSCWHLIEQ